MYRFKKSKFQDAFIKIYFFLYGWHSHKWKNLLHIFIHFIPYIFYIGEKLVFVSKDFVYQKTFLILLEFANYWKLISCIVKRNSVHKSNLRQMLLLVLAIIIFYYFSKPLIYFAKIVFNVLISVHLLA